MNQVIIYCYNSNNVGFIQIYRYLTYVFGPIGLKFFMGTQETVIYRLVMRNPSNIAYFSFFIFRATFYGKMF